MNWYTARVLFRWEVGGKPHPFEESYLLVRAESDRGALRAAARASRSREESYQNTNGQQVTSALVSVLDVQELLENELSEGVEVYSRRVTSRAAGRMLKETKRSRKNEPDGPRARQRRS